MKLKLACSHCGALLSVDAKHRGKRGKCPKCGSVVLIPAADDGARTGSPSNSNPAAEPRGGRAEGEAPDTAALVRDVPHITALARDIMSCEGVGISDKVNQDRWAAGLVKYGDAAVPVIREILLNTRLRTHLDFRNAAVLCETLGRIGGDQARDVLKMLGSDHSAVAEFSIVRQAAQRALACQLERTALQGTERIKPQQEISRVADDRVSEIAEAYDRGQPLHLKPEEIHAMCKERHGREIRVASEPGQGLRVRVEAIPLSFAIAAAIESQPNTAYAECISALVKSYASQHLTVTTESFGVAIARAVRALGTLSKVVQELLDLYFRERHANIRAVILAALGELREHRARPLVEEWLAKEVPGKGKLVDWLKSLLVNALQKLRGDA